MPLYSKIEADVRYRLRLYNDIDWALMLNREAIVEMFERAGSVRALGKLLDLPTTATRDLMDIYAIPVGKPGGNRVKEKRNAPPSSGKTAKQLLTEVGGSYSAKDKAAMIACARAGKTCVRVCPLYFSCWDGPPEHGEHRKRRACCLEEHLRLTGVLTGDHQ
jgi:hypothetical protein